MRDRVFIFAVAFVGVLAVLILLQNVRESTAPLYGPPTVDKELVMSKVESGAVSFKEARFYVREENDRRKTVEQEAPGESGNKTEHRNPGEGPDPAGGPDPGQGHLKDETP